MSYSAKRTQTKICEIPKPTHISSVLDNPCGFVLCPLSQVLPIRAVALVETECHPRLLPSSHLSYLLMKKACCSVNSISLRSAFSFHPIGTNSSSFTFPHLFNWKSLPTSSAVSSLILLGTTFQKTLKNLCNTVLLRIVN